MTVRRDQRECIHAATPSGDVVSVTRCVGEGWDVGLGDDRMLWVSDEGVAALRDVLVEAVPTDAGQDYPGRAAALRSRIDAIAEIVGLEHGAGCWFVVDRVRKLREKVEKAERVAEVHRGEAAQARDRREAELDAIAEAVGLPAMEGEGWSASDVDVLVETARGARVSFADALGRVADALGVDVARRSMLSTGELVQHLELMAHETRRRAEGAESARSVDELTCILDSIGDMVGAARGGQSWSHLDLAELEEQLQVELARRTEDTQDDATLDRIARALGWPVAEGVVWSEESREQLVEVAMRVRQIADALKEALDAP